MASALEIIGLVVGYRGVPVLGPLDAIFSPGRLHGLVGPNGVGKTTLLRSLLGLLPPLRGEVRGMDGARSAYVPQVGRLDPEFPASALEIVGMGVRGARSRRARSLSALERVGLAGRASERFARLSGGQRQRVLVARALASEADLLALDEPTAGVDGASSESLWGLARGIAQSGALVLVATHDLFSLPRFADVIHELSPDGVTQREIFHDAR